MRIESLSPETKGALIALKRALAAEPGALHFQITMDEVRNTDMPGIEVDGIFQFSSPENIPDIFVEVTYDNGE